MRSKQTTSVLTTLFLVTTVWLTACETTVDVDFPRQEPVMTLSSFFSPDDPFELCLSEARDLVDGRDAIRDIANAKVELQENGRTIEVLPYAGDCLYRSTTHRPVAGKRYTVRASSGDYPDVEAEDIVPMAVEADFEWEIDRQGPDAGSINVTIRLHDPPETDNWYRIMVFFRHYDQQDRPWYQTPGFDTDDQAVLADNQDFIELNSGSHHETVFFRDTRLDHGPAGHEIHLEIPEPPRGVPITRTDLIVMLDNISKHFYDYAVTERLHRAVKDNPFAEPVQVATNVKNGFGVFGGFNRKVLDVNVK